MIKHLILLLVVISIVELCIILKFKKTVLKLIEQIKNCQRLLSFQIKMKNMKNYILIYQKIFFFLH